MQYVAFLFGIILSIIIIVYYCKLRKKNGNKKFIFSIFAAVLITIILEIFTFNFDAFENFSDENGLKAYHWDAATGSVTDTLVVTPSITEEKNTYTIQLNKINTATKTMDISFEGKAEAATCSLFYQDEASERFRRVDAVSFAVVPKVFGTGHIKLDLSGKTKALQLKMESEKFPIKSIDIKLNNPIGIHLNALRMSLIFFFLLFAFVISYSWNEELSLMGKESLKIDKSKRKIWVIICCFICVEIVWMVNLARSSKENFSFFMEETAAPDVYQELTLALSNGKVDLNDLNAATQEAERQNLEAISNLPNPYDMFQRTPYHYKWDRALYHGKYYCYYGIVPEILFYYPIYLITGKLLNTHLLTLFLCVLLICAIAKFVYDIARRWQKNMNIWVLLCAILGYINTSMVFFLMEKTQFYEIAKVSALLFTILGLDLLYNAFDDKKADKVQLTFGALCMALSVGCRPNFILASVIALIIVFQGFTTKRYSRSFEKYSQRIKGYCKDLFCKENISGLLCFALPYVIIGIGLMYYNYIRFDSITEFGARYQLTVYDVRYYSIGDIRKLPTAIYDGLFAMPEFSGIFPFMKSLVRNGEYFGYEFKLKNFGVMFFPMMWLLALLPWSLRRGIKQNQKRAMAIAAIVLGLLSCYITTAMGATGTGYTIDYAWLLYIPIIYILFDLYERAKKRNMTKYILGIIFAITFVTVICGTLLSLSYAQKSIDKTDPVFFYTLKEMIVFW